MFKPYGTNISVEVQVVPDELAYRVGTVVGMGDYIDDGKHPVSAGDTVYFSQFSGVSISVGGREITVLQQGDILGVVKNG